MIERMPRTDGQPQAVPRMPLREYERLTLRARCEVVAVNERLCNDLGLKLEVGKPTDLGVFLKFDNDTAEFNEDARIAGIRNRHHRSADLDTELVETSDGDILRDTDIKGGGLISRETGTDVIPWTNTPYGRVEGLMDEESALHDMRMSRRFKELGIDTDEIVAVIRPLELPVMGNDGVCRMVPVENIPRGPADKPTHGTLPHGFTPALVIRKYGTKTRVDDVISPEGSFGPRPSPDVEQDRREYIQDAIELIRFKDPTVTDIREYTYWFAKRLGRNVGRMARAGLLHRFLFTRHNVTLDCRITDRDSVQERPIPLDETSRQLDFDGGLVTINNFAIELCALYPEIREWYGRGEQTEAGKTAKTVAALEEIYHESYEVSLAGVEDDDLQEA